MQTLSNAHQEIGSGMIGELPEAQDALAVLHHIKTQLGVPVIRHTQLLEKKIKKIVVKEFIFHCRSYFRSLYLLFDCY